MIGRVLAACVLLLAAVSPAVAHGASRGLHLHVEPDPAVPGEKVTVRIDASSPVREVRIAFAGREPEVERRRHASRTIRVEIDVPSNASGTVSLQAEAITRDGRTLRAAAVVGIRDDDPSSPSGSCRLQVARPARDSVSRATDREGTLSAWNRSTKGRSSGACGRSWAASRPSSSFAARPSSPRKFSG